MGKLLLVACTNVGRYIIEEFMNNPNIGAELVGVVNLNHKQGSTKANYDAYSDLNIKYDVPFHYCDNINDPETVQFMRGLQPDIILQSGWSQKFSDEVLQIPTYACIGEHPAPLPKGRGAACVNWAILTGETDWGDSYFKMVQEYDKGELYAQRFFKITPFDSVYTVYEKVALCAKQVVSEYAARWCNGEFDIVEQDPSMVTYYKRRRPSDGEIKSFNQPAQVVHNFIRAQTHPYPGAYIETTKGKLYLLSSIVIGSAAIPRNAGIAFSTSDRGGVLVSAGDNTVIEILRVKPEGSPSQWASDFFSNKALPMNLSDL